MLFIDKFCTLIHFLKMGFPSTIHPKMLLLVSKNIERPMRNSFCGKLWRGWRGTFVQVGGCFEIDGGWWLKP